jgi:gas vesicle protein
MDYSTICQIVEEKCNQILGISNITGRVESEVKNQLNHKVEENIKQLVDEKFNEVKENIRTLNQQIVILKEAIETIAIKHTQ